MVVINNDVLHINNPVMFSFSSICFYRFTNI